MILRVKKADDELQVLFAEAYAPTPLKDADEDVMTAEEIRAMAYRFMYRSDMHLVDTQHNREKNGCTVVESFIAREGDPDFLLGAWVLGIYVPDPMFWAQIKAEEYRGLSLDFDYLWDEVEYEIELPEYLEGDTKEAAGHKHRFIVRFDDEGNFLGGETDVVNGHKHFIRHGTKTTKFAGHDHTYSFIELLSPDGVVLVSSTDETE